LTQQIPTDPLTPNLPIIDAILRSIARRHRLSPDQAEDLEGLVKLRLIENDFAIIRKFRGESSPQTYLSVVINRLCLDFRASTTGKFRPSVAARTMGRVGVELERLLLREKHTFGEACEILRSRGHTNSEDELHALALRLPVRRAQVFTVDPADLEDIARGALETPESQQCRTDLRRHVFELLRDLPVEDRLTIRMHFLENVTIAEIARALKVHEQPLRRRLGRLLRDLRGALEQRGIDRSILRQLFP
jgi:RNA polymerase sigma factor (sigma-70 family)